MTRYICPVCKTRTEQSPLIGQRLEVTVPLYKGWYCLLCYAKLVNENIPKLEKEMRHYNIFGDETTNPNEFIYCTACRHEVDAGMNYEEGECLKCGAALMDAESIITGAMMKREIAAVDNELAEWTALNKPNDDSARKP